MEIIDAHIHYWEPATADRPHDEEGLYISEPWVYESVIQEAVAAGVDKITQITPSILGYDNRYSFEIAARHPDRVFGVFARFDPDPPQIVERLRALSTQPCFVGIRFTTRLPVHRSWWDNGTIDKVFDACARLSVPIAIHYPQGAKRLADVKRRFPETVLLVDHMALDHVPNPFAHWDDVLALADLPNLYQKVSFFPEAAKVDEEYPFSGALPRLREIYERYGAGRLIWGSNFPSLPRRGITYRQAVDFIKNAPFIPPADMTDIMGGTLAGLIGRMSAERSKRTS